MDWGIVTSVLVAIPIFIIGMIILGIPDYRDRFTSGCSKWWHAGMPVDVGYEECSARG